MTRDQSGGLPLTPRRRCLLTCIAAAIGCVAALAVGELMIRVAEPRADTPGIPMPGSGRLYGYAPHAAGYAGGRPFRTNAFGFRGPDFADVASGREAIVVVLGDSYAFGYGVDDSSTFPVLLEQALQQSYPGERARVINLGIPGYDTSQELAVLQEWGPRLRPRLVLLQYHLNDIQRRPQSGAAADAARPGIGPRLAAAMRYMHLLRFAMPRVAAVARALGAPLRTTATAEVADYVGNLPAWRRNQATLLQVAEAARLDGARFGVLVVPYMVELNDRHPPAPAYETVLRFCQEHHIPVVNAFDYFKGLRAGALWISPFDGHPNAAGHRLLARAAADLVVKSGGLEAR